MMIRSWIRLDAKKRRGFTLIELAIVLAVASLLFAGLWRLMSSGNTQLRDQAAADQHKQLIAAVQGYLATTEGQSNFMAPQAANANFLLALPTSNTSNANCRASMPAPPAPSTANAGFCDYLPIGFTNATTNSYGQTYAIRVLKDGQAAGTAPKSYSFMILTSGGEAIADTSGGRIASMIGNDGGFVYSAGVCNAAGAAKDWACGAYGSWSVTLATYGLVNGGATGGYIASRTYAGLTASQDAPWLARTPIANPTIGAGGTPDFNTIQADTYLGKVSGSVVDAVIYGAQSGYGGAIKNLKEMVVGRSDATGNAPLIVNGNSCITNSPSAADVAACNYLLQVNGSAAVKDLLTSNKLFAGQFIYDTSSSDRRLKDDIKPLDGALGKLSQMNGYSFLMKGGEEKKYGVIAQEVEKVFPEIVHEMADGHKSVDYMGLIGPLVAAVRELKAENEKLQAEIDALKTQNTKTAKKK